MRDLIAEATAIAQGYDLAVFPVSKEKRPIVKGWQAKATKCPDEIARLFAEPGAAGVGVPCGPENDVICFDLDYGHNPTPEQINWLKKWEMQLGDMLETKQLKYQPQQHTTRSGGKHIIFAWPKDATKTPRNIMPKLEVIGRGFYFVWPTEGSGYDIVVGQSIWPRCPEKLIDQWPEAWPQGKVGGGINLMSAEDAHEVMMTDGQTGERHAALLRMTHDYARDHPEMDLLQLCETFADYFYDIYAQYIDTDRLDTMLAFDVRGNEAEGELGRAFKGAYATPQRAMKRLAAHRGRMGNTAEWYPEVATKIKAAPRVQEPETVEVDEDDENPWDAQPAKPIDWLVEGIIERGSIVGISGTSNAGKTRWLTLLLACLSTGNMRPLGFEMDTPPVRTMMVANEENNDALIRRLKAVRRANGMGKLQKRIEMCGKGWLKDEAGRKIPHTQLLRIGEDGRNLEVNESVLEAVIKRINDTGAELVTFDPYTTLGAYNENAQHDNNLMFGVFQDIADRTGATIVFVHHAGKGDSRTESPDAMRGLMGAFRGSSVITSSMDTGFTLLPYLSHEISKTPKDRAKVAELIKAGTLTNYVVLDFCKVREGLMGEAKFYKIIAHTLAEGFDIGVMVPATQEEADEEQRVKILTGKAMKFTIAPSAIANAIAATYHDGDWITMRSFHEVAQARAIPNWPTAKRQPTATQQPACFKAMNQLAAAEMEAEDGTLVALRKDKKGGNDGWYVKLTEAKS